MTYKIKEWYERNFVFFPFVILVFYSLGRGLGNTFYYIFLLSSFFLLMGRIGDVKKIHILFLVVFVSLIGVSTFNPNATNIKDFIVFFISSSSAFLLFSSCGISELRKMKDFFFWIAFFLLSVETIQAAYFYTLAYDGMPASGVSIWNMMIIFPYLLLGNKKITHDLALVVCVLILVVLSASRAEFVSYFLALSVFFGLKYRKVFHLLLVIPVSALAAILVNTVFRDKDLSFNNMESFASRLTSRRSDMWLAAFRDENHNFWFGNGFGSSYQLYEKISAASVHNVIVELWWESGFFSVLIFTFILAFLVFKIWRMAYSVFPEYKEFFCATGASFFVVIVVMMLDKSFYDLIPRYYFFFFSGLLIAIGRFASDGVYKNCFRK